MPPTAAEARRERIEARDDIQQEGAAVLLRFDKSHSAEGSGRQKPAEDWVNVKTYALVEAMSTGEVAVGGEALIGDKVVWIADLGLGALADLPTLPSSGAPVGSAYLMYFASDGFPAVDGSGVVTGAGLRQFQLLRVLDTIKVGNASVLHKVHARG